MHRKVCVTGNHREVPHWQEKLQTRSKQLQQEKFRTRNGSWRHLPGAKETGAPEGEEKFEYQPKISIVIPLYKTPEKYLRQLVETVKAQTYPNWELCLSDGSGENSPIAELLKFLAASDERIRVISHKEPLQISENTNAGIEIATGDYIAFADHDDELTPHALFECVKALNKNREIRLLYSDEDKMSMDGHKFFQPAF